mgnify:CR=1 FL=1
MEKDHLAYHETVDTHELLNLRTVGLLKSKLMQGVVFDQELRKLMQKNVETSIMDMKELKRLYPEKSPE